VIQAVGPRVQQYYDRPWGTSTRRSQLVVIGQKGLDEAAIRAVLAAILAPALVAAR
jgi:cobalamin biosynthesis protein CobW